MHPRTNRSAAIARQSVNTVSTLSLINEAYSRLRASAAAYENACGYNELCAIKVWMESFGHRLNGMADALQDEGARARKSLENSAKALYEKDVCSSPAKLLTEAERNQEEIIKAFDLISERLDMDADLYELLTDQHEELSEALVDMSELRREYETYGAAA